MFVYFRMELASFEARLNVRYFNSRYKVNIFLNKYFLGHSPFNIPFQFDDTYYVSCVLD